MFTDLHSYHTELYPVSFKQQKTLPLYCSALGQKTEKTLWLHNFFFIKKINTVKHFNIYKTYKKIIIYTVKCQRQSQIIQGNDYNVYQQSGLFVACLRKPGLQKSFKQKNLS